MAHSRVAIFMVEIADEADALLVATVLQETGLGFQRTNNASINLDDNVPVPVPKEARPVRRQSGEQTEVEMRVRSIDVQVENTDKRVSYRDGGDFMVRGRDPDAIVALEVSFNSTDPLAKALMQRIAKFGRVILKAVG